MPDPADANSPKVFRWVRKPRAYYVAVGLCVAPSTLQLQAQAVSPADSKLGSVAEEVQPALPERDETACRPVPGEGPEMVVIPGGFFRMGSPSDEPGRDSDEGPQREVGVSRPFAIGRCEVTVAEFRQFVEETGHQASADGCYVWNARAKLGEQDNAADWRKPGFRQTEQDPVVCVNWRDANAYAQWLSQRSGAAYRLPTEAEWEYATRAGTTTSRFWGDKSELACEFANVADRLGKGQFPDWINHDCDDGQVFTAPVASYRPNAFGLYDALGNVWEWVADCWSDRYSGFRQDTAARQPPEGETCDRRVVRGGGWDDQPANVRSANRRRVEPDVALNSDLGFRLARTLP